MNSRSWKKENLKKNKIVLSTDISLEGENP
jgi:hypothetical protein